MSCSCSCSCCCCSTNEEEENDLPLQEEIKNKMKYVNDNCANQIKISLKEGENLLCELFKTYNNKNENENDSKNKINKVKNEEAIIQETTINNFLNKNNNQNKYNIMFSISYAEDKQEKVKEDDLNNFRVQIKLYSDDKVELFICDVGKDKQITNNIEIKNILKGIKKKICDGDNLVSKNVYDGEPKVDDNSRKYILGYIILDCFVESYLKNIEKNNKTGNKIENDNKNEKKEDNDTLFKKVLDKIEENIKLWNDHNSSKNNEAITKNNLENINNSNNNINININNIN